MIPVLLLGILIGSMATLIVLFLWGEINNKYDEIKGDRASKTSWSLTRIKE
ncbi:MAG: hypothetical protein JRJ39_00525 [Deltaproteobacteria bacterium]|nr:hypothetical protein [Deltaproteobacteria bacterium]MBW1845594.1 hypothetical protein [Deltaproteobacteria bacterium]MBW2032022.1 hypothetical protein [Deltaproteobacteria bacterium]